MYQEQMDEWCNSQTAHAEWQFIAAEMALASAKSHTMTRELAHLIAKVNDYDTKIATLVSYKHRMLALESALKTAEKENAELREQLRDVQSKVENIENGEFCNRMVEIVAKRVHDCVRKRQNEPAFVEASTSLAFAGAPTFVGASTSLAFDGAPTFGGASTFEAPAFRGQALQSSLTSCEDAWGYRIDFLQSIAPWCTMPDCEAGAAGDPCLANAGAPPLPATGAGAESDAGAASAPAPTRAAAPTVTPAPAVASTVAPAVAPTVAPAPSPAVAPTVAPAVAPSSAPQEPPAVAPTVAPAPSPGAATFPGAAAPGPAAPSQHQVLPVVPYGMPVQPAQPAPLADETIPRGLIIAEWMPQHHHFQWNTGQLRAGVPQQVQPSRPCEHGMLGWFRDYFNENSEESQLYFASRRDHNPLFDKYTDKLSSMCHSASTIMDLPWRGRNPLLFKIMMSRPSLYLQWHSTKSSAFYLCIGCSNCHARTCDYQPQDEVASDARGGQLRQVPEIKKAFRAFLVAVLKVPELDSEECAAALADSWQGLQ